jgi:hypothetical protein
VEAYLRCFTQSCPAKWSQWLSLAEFWYNTNFHSALGKSPFEVLYGHPPGHFGIEGVEHCAIPDLEEWLKERKTMNFLLQQQLLRAQQRMKLQADKHRTERSFEVGEKVWLKLQPYVQSSVAHRASHKLAFKYFGPYLIEDKIGSVAYKLALPSGSKVHPVFHVSLLKKVKGNHNLLSSPLPPSDEDLREPEMILDRRLKNIGKRTIWQVLVKWRGWPAELATWEDEDLLLPRLKNARACGQAVIQEQGNVTNNGTAGGVGATTEATAGSTPGEEEKSEEEKANRPKRALKPNVKLSGPEWLRG